MKVKTTKKLVMATLLILAGAPAFAQTGFAVGALTADPSAALDVSSASLGVLLPRVGLTGTSDNSTIATPATGLLVYNTAATINNLPGLVYNSGTSTAPVWSRFDTQGQNWGLRGNSNTSPATSFLGTTDAQPLVFRTNGAEVARFTTGGAFWLNAANNNMLLGYQAGNAVGSSAQSNSYLGYQAGAANVSGYFNTVLGYQAMQNGTGGNFNVIMGGFAGRANTSGQNNVFLGYQAGINNTVGLSNVFIGSLTGNASVSGLNNVFIGNNAGFASTANNNVLIGSGTGQRVTSGASNVLLGVVAGDQVTTGTQNTILGYTAGQLVTSGSNGVFIGYRSGIASQARQHTNVVAIGTNAVVDQDNSIVLGGSGANAVNVGIGTATPSEVLQVAGNILASGTITQNSDRRLKTNVRPLAGALASVERLRGVRYEFLAGKGPTGPQVGVIAQEVEEVYPELVRTDAVTGIKSVNYAQLTPVLLEAIKELQAQLAVAKNEAGQLRKEQAQTTASIEAISARLHVLEGAVSVPTVAR